MNATRWVLVGLLGVGLSLGCDEKPKVVSAVGQPFYTSVAQTISLNQELLERLGEPVTFGESILKSREGDNNVGTALVEVELSGPKGKGKAQVKVVKANPNTPWTSKGGDYFPTEPAGPPIHLQGR